MLAAMKLGERQRWFGSPRTDRLAGGKGIQVLREERKTENVGLGVWGVVLEAEPGD